MFTHGCLSEAKDGEREREKERKREKERPKVGNNNGLLRIATPPRVALAKPPGPILSVGEYIDGIYIA